MTSVEDHYEQFLAGHYTWMAGGFDQKVVDNRKVFELLGLKAGRGSRALDLGCGSGFQSAALASLGYSVVAIDSSKVLIAELRERAPDPNIVAIVGDLRDAGLYSSHGPFDVAVCMGDTLTHLATIDEVSHCCACVRGVLKPGGTLVLSFRDLTTELKGIDRAIPVRLDDERLMATFLEYEPHHVVVNDMLFERENGVWKMRKSAYRKLRTSPAQIVELLEKLGYHIVRQTSDRGFCTIVAQA